MRRQFIPQVCYQIISVTVQYVCTVYQLTEVRSFRGAVYGNISCSVFICHSGGYTGTVLCVHRSLIMSLYNPSPLNW
jgi:hypothetical protein